MTTFVFGPYFRHAAGVRSHRWPVDVGLRDGGCGPCHRIVLAGAWRHRRWGGHRKPWIALFGLVLAIGCSLLWFAQPGVPGAFMIALVAFAVATIAAEFAHRLQQRHDADAGTAASDRAASRERAGRRLCRRLVSLVITLGFLAADPATKRTLLGFMPLFGARSGNLCRRFVFQGPLSALWFIVFVTPMFLLTPDVAPRRPIHEAVRVGLATLRATLKQLPRRNRCCASFLANMIYADGLVALFAFGGILCGRHVRLGDDADRYLRISADHHRTFGALAGGWLDDRFGPKPSSSEPADSDRLSLCDTCRSAATAFSS